MNPGICRINLKRTDAKWSEWSEELQDSAAEWKRWKKRICRHAYHGGIQTCDGSKDLVLEWYTFEQNQLLSWHKARRYCQNAGGDLFWSLNGTNSQHQFLAKKMNYKKFWIGVNDIDIEGTWQNVRGDILGPDKIKWATNEPDKSSNGVYANCVLLDGGLLKININKIAMDFSGTNNKHRFVCEYE